jgi:hypothetical protein
VIGILALARDHARREGSQLFIGEAGFLVAKPGETGHALSSAGVARNNREKSFAG